MKIPFNIFLSTFLLVYSLAAFYVGRHGWQMVKWLGGQKHFLMYWLGYTVLAATFFAGRIVQAKMPGPFSNWLALVGSYWLGVLYYAFFILLVIDLIRLLNRYFKFLPSGSWANPAVIGWGVILLVAAIVIYGSWNALNPRINRYELTIPKQAGSIKQLHAVMVSDIHLGHIVDNSRLQHMVQQINALQPDIIMLAGDIIDGDVEPFFSQNMPATLSQLRAPLGIYAILGNHEYYGGKSDVFVEALIKANIRVLRDEVVRVADSFYVAGRNDRSLELRSPKGRRPLNKLLANIDHNLPIILLDHQPYNLGDSQKLGVDLQLSGHTHHGQMFPNNFITGYIFEQDWGYLRKGNTHVIVSCGYGTWGPPLRTGNHPEIVDIIIHFAN